MEWDSGFDRAMFDHLTERAGTIDELPDGCLTRIVGRVESGARVIEVWESDQDAQRFAERTTPLIQELKIPPPTSVAAFPTTVFIAKT